MLFGKHINKYYGKYWYLFIIGILAMIAVDWLQLYIPEFLGDITDLLVEGYIASEIINQVIQIAIKVLIIAAGLMIGRILWRLTILNASKRIECDLRQEMFEKAERLSRDFYHENKVGTIMAWFTSDVETIQEFFAWGTVMLVDAIFLSLLCLIKMFALDIVLTLLSLVPLLLIVIWGLLVEKIMTKKWAERQQANDKIYDFSSENFTGIRVIKAFVKERKEMRQFAKVAKENFDVNYNFIKVSVFLDVVIEVIIALIVFLILSFGGYQVYQGSSTVFWGITIEHSAGHLVTFYGYFESIVWPMIALGQIITFSARAKESLKRISRFLDAPETIKNPENAIVLKDVKGKITFKNFSFFYSDGTEEMLKNISLEINPGEKVGIVGKIGSGKSTMANVLCRVFNVQENTVFIDDVDIMKADIPSLHDAVSYVPQDNFLFSDSIRNNIAFSDDKLNDQIIKNAAKFANVDNDIENFEHGYKTMTGERGVTLSGGQKQRISIARAFIKDSPIMILDDSVSAVDVSTEEAILKNIEELRNGKTTIVVASRVSTVSQFDKIIVLKDGELEAFGSPNELLKTSETYKRMVLSQKLQKEVEGGN